jgi:hypothetical protein
MAVGAGTAGADRARQAARAILRERRFHNPSVPRPLHGVLTTIGNGLRHAGHAVVHVVDALGAHVPGGAPVLWVILGLLVCAAAGLLARGRADTVLGRHHRATAAVRPPTAGELEARADVAEAAGRLKDALRLRFAAGLQTLSEAELVSSPATRPSGELARQLRSADFDALAGRFDEVVYGGDAARDEDVREARRRWPQVVEQGRRR